MGTFFIKTLVLMLIGTRFIIFFQGTEIFEELFHFLSVKRLNKKLPHLVESRNENIIGEQEILRIKLFQVYLFIISMDSVLFNFGLIELDRF